ncbi:unnamed protein product [Bemisia tabaci]|uniref:Sperm microtubule inner protein 1 C-terminal domain-containing protein n=1 Tax=Bemisia tabaci TaxID=7038 RepID=A0A9P0ABI2_BEMTA|nr:unnamed protein product [Bemisia tabaci]
MCVECGDSNHAESTGRGENKLLLKINSTNEGNEAPALDAFFSAEGATGGHQEYLRERSKLSPEEKFAFPVLSSHSYGWRILCAYYPRKTYARKTKDFRAGDAGPMPYT